MEPVDLSRFSVMHTFARTTQSARLLAFLMRIDEVDRWAVDYREDESPNALNIGAFIAGLQSFLGSGGLEALSAAPKEFLELLGGLRSSRCLYLLKMSNERNPELSNQLDTLLATAGSNDRLVLVVRRRLEAVNKAQLLGEIFSSSRLERIKSIMGVERER